MRTAREELIQTTRGESDISEFMGKTMNTTVSCFYMHLVKEMLLQNSLILSSANLGRAGKFCRVAKAVSILKTWLQCITTHHQ